MSEEHMHGDGILIHEAEARKRMDALDDRIAKELIRYCIGTARLSCARSKGTTEQEWRAGLPTAPFDMDFFARVLARVFTRRDTVERILAGESVAAATGWDV